MLKTKKAMSLSFGFVTTLLLMIPILNIFIIPAAIAGATHMYCDHWHQKDSLN